MRVRDDRLLVSALLAATMLGACGDAAPVATPPPAEAAAEAPVSGLRRLSVAEYRHTVVDLLGVDPAGAGEVLPAETLAPFDNDYTLQTPSEALIKGAELLAGDVAAAIVGSPELRETVVGCAGRKTAACFRSFVTKLGRRALRRPLSDAETSRFAGLLDLAAPDGDFWFAVNAAIRAFLQHPELLYRVEIGTPIPDRPGVFRLGPHELAARLSYFLIGSTPPDWLLDAADSGALVDENGIALAAAELLADDRARTRLARFHSMWLGYDKLSRQGLFGAMHFESEALLERVIFDERRPWTDVLTLEETFVTPELAEHYGLAWPGPRAGWVDYADTGRRGLLSHGTFLSAAPKFGDTSPTQRGLLVRTRLFCQSIANPPPNLNVNVDEPPVTSDPDACKKERYFMAEDPLCGSCHGLMDPIGFGLEAYDQTGKLRLTEHDRPDCPIDGEGEVQGVGTFNGPGELAQLAVQSGMVEACVARQLYRFATGRTELDEHDMALLDRIVATSSSDGGLELHTFITAYVGSESFGLRRDEEVAP